MAVDLLRARWAWVPQQIERMLDARQGSALDPIRAEILGPTRLEAHGRCLALSQHAGKAAFGRATFYPRLQSNIRTLRASFRYIAAQADDGHDLSPAAEWLLDNFHLIEDQLREIHEGLPARYYASLPVLQDAPLVGLPRIYGVAWAFVAHTDSAFDEALLIHFLNAYQDERALTQGELWALPTTLRVVLVENLRRLADRLASHKAARALATLCVQRIQTLDLEAVQAMHKLMNRRGVGLVFLAHLAQGLATQRATPEQAPLANIQAWLQQTLPDWAALQMQLHADQAADSLSVGNAVTALRLIGAADWPDTIARTSRVMRVMLASPVFVAEDDATRSATLHGIERLALRSGHDEATVARVLLAAMTAASGPAGLAQHALAGDGRPALEQALGMGHRASVAARVWRLAVRRGRTPGYLGALALGTVLLVAGLLHAAGWRVDPSNPAFSAASTWLGLLVGALMLLPASEAVGSVVNRLITESARPVHLPRFALAQGIPATARVMVVVPALLSHPQAIAQAVHRLHLHYLANPEPCAQFALLSDWADADTPEQASDAALLAQAHSLLSALNERYPALPGDAPRFVLLHRARSYSETQRQWIGWERKRGKLEQLVAALVSHTPGPFLDLGALSHMAADTRYLLTLDSDTQLPPGRLRALVGVALHPENQPRLDASGQRVVQGYGILQPRVVAPLPAQARPTPWQWLMAGQQGIDPYSATTSDVYQDLLGEGSFTGKGLLHVATLHAVLGARLPTEQVLSHDLLEGALVRCGVVSDVTLIEPEPEHVDAAAARLHRWARGDWQLLPFLLQRRRWPLTPINRWKLLDNLRRSLVAPASLLLIGLASAGQGLPLWSALALVLAAYAGGPVMGALAGCVPARAQVLGPRFVRAGALDGLRALGGGLWQLALLPRQAVLFTDAAVRALYRLAVSRRHLLEWTTADAAQASLKTALRATLVRHRSAPVTALVLLLVLGLSTPAPGALALVLLALWAVTPLLVWLANRPWPAQPGAALAPADRDLLAGVARDTWRLFERCVDAPNNHLPPDNLQTVPFETVAHRTSPTNIGLYLLSAACARQFGWIGTQDLLARLDATLATLHQMERHHGHFLNWYGTQTLQPLLPRYVSTVDSGNLSAHLLAVAQACAALARDPFAALANERAVQCSLARLRPQVGLLPRLLHRAGPESATGRLLAQAPAMVPGTPAFEHVQTLLRQARGELDAVTPPHNPLTVGTEPTDCDELAWLLGDHIATVQSASLDALAAHAGQRAQTTQRLLAMADALEQLAWAPDFRFLYHPRRHLLHIGYRVLEQQLDTSFYDLLASESRTTSLLAMAKGDVPVRHWSALGRPFFASGTLAVLRSWSGSMFEYLMPTLVLAEPQGSVLHEAGRSALQAQRAFVRERGIPWGISESAHAGRDHTLAYQYAPQGVPNLALRTTPAAECVIAPYATALAAQIDPALACQNLRALSALAARGRYGFVEALDYTHTRQSHGQGFTLVSTYMAHHQGMSIVALANVLLGGVAQRWGAANARIEAVAALLHERAPRDLPRLQEHPQRPLPISHRHRHEASRTVVPGAQALEPTQLLSNGRYSVTLRANGAGWSRWGSTGISRWRDDALRDACGHFVYLRQGQAGTPVSLTSHPAPDPGATYQSRFQTDRVCFEAHWPEQHTLCTVWVSPEDDIEFRKLVFTNLSDRAVEVELIACWEVTLASHAADEAHPAFSNLFVQADWLPGQQALRFERRPRLPTETTVQAVHFVADTEGEVLGLRCQTDRLAWLGRNHAPSQPRAHLVPVPGAAGVLPTGLDPVAALGVTLRVAPGAQARVTFATAVSDDAATLMAVLDKYRQPSYVERASVMSATVAGIPSLSQRLHADHLCALQALTTAMVLTLPKQGPAAGHRKPTPPAACDRRVLWPLGISGDRPLLLVTAGVPEGLAVLRALVQALREWSRCGVACDLVLLSSEPHSYLMPLQRELVALQAQHANDQLGRQGPAVTGLHLLRADTLSSEQFGALQALARVRIRTDGHPLLPQITAWCAQHERPPSLRWHGAAAVRVPCHQPDTRTAAVGHFDPDSGAFRFDVGPAQRPGKPWINVLANPALGTQVSESGAGNTWALNSRLNQLTAWSNDPVADPPAEWFLLQDRRTGEAWSLAPSAWGHPQAVYQVEHGQGYTRIGHRHGPLAVELRWCVDAHTAVKQVSVRLVNHGTRTAYLRLTGLVEWMMGEKRSDRATLHTQAHHTDPASTDLLGLLCTQTEAGQGFGGGTAFFCAVAAGAHTANGSPDADSPGLNDGLDWTCDRGAFFDPQGQLVLPEHLGQRSGDGLDPCAAISRLITLRPGASQEQRFLLGYAASPAEAQALALQAVRTTAAERERCVRAQWDALLGATQVSTPDPLLDALVNRWLLYQTVSSRLWAKAGFYQAGGATGFRDQLQDAMALVWAQPGILRDQIVLCASRQFEAGDVQHWWHDPGGAGVRTHFSDDLLWLPFACAHYLRVTGDTAVLDHRVPFLDGPPVPEGAEDAYDTPRTSEATASVYEHAARTIDRSLAVGVHGLPLMGTGDWNDGMNRVGHEGRGESVWLAWFLCAIVTDWIPLARHRGEHLRAARWHVALQCWGDALQTTAWDGGWYARAYFDGGSALGSHRNAEARIDLIAQAWSVLSGMSHSRRLLERQRLAMDAVEHHLVDAQNGLIQLLAPPLAQATPSAGYIQAYPPGVRENGGQYAHAGVWALMAAAALAVRERAPGPTEPGHDHAAGDTPYRYFTYLSPAHRAQHADGGAAYGLEPYVMAADVYSQPPYVGRGGWSWYTGAAGWMHRAAVESLLGLQLRADGLRFVPCLPSHWPRAELRLTRDGRTLRFVLLRATPAAAQAACTQMGGRLLPVAERLRWADWPGDGCFVIPLPPSA
ncbi:MAG: glucoamylase family protein [Hydrogenophaga sp.]|uniref:GH36-type glycosyl hydrolase domain-containing protein n=1 Tax=Hydrogenophaga sp. TaxID=1904254 RepID=UPI002734E815|nr:glucoamylase family protein [Hydrogenophaga sp.]MDP3343232.1 glucoamylase family protein [Hydrogenophaga sp.]MDP3808372.1 glucoamylase family protein [Hydrogenophaga sp.]